MKKYLNIINKEDGLIKSGLIFMVGSLLASAFNYLYHLLIGRMLGPSDYGTLGVLFSIIYIVMFSTGTFTKVLAKFTSEYNGNKNKKNIITLFRKSTKKISIYGFLLLIVYVIIAPLIQNFLKLDSVTGIIIVGAIAYLSLINAIFQGVLNGLEMFVWQNLSTVISTTLKLGLGTLLVYLGFGVNGALLGVLTGIIIGIIFAIISLFDYLFEKSANVSLDTKRIYNYIAPVFVATLISTAVITIDHLIVKHYFSSTDSGLYAAAGMIGKIIWFGSGFFAGAIFPKISKLVATGKNPVKLLQKSIMYTAILAVIGSTVFFIMPEFIVSLLYGVSYISIAPIIGLFGLSLGIYSIIQIMVVYNLAIEKHDFIWILLFGLVFEVIGIMNFHSNISNVVNVLFFSNLLIMIMLLFNIKIFQGDAHEN
jgi:O-antigen/teichoic acid export membrane protein